MKEKIKEHIENKWPFILYSDKENYIKCNPKVFSVEYNHKNVYPSTRYFNNKEGLLPIISVLSQTFSSFHSLNPVMKTDSDYKQNADKIKVIDYADA